MLPSIYPICGIYMADVLDIYAQRAGYIYPAGGIYMAVNRLIVS
ncbi:MAG: hypothetical protein Q4D56_08310 [Bacteroides sp.]|nr:hypothetical protein [Bacteroides sp.]